MVGELNSCTGLGNRVRPVSIATGAVFLGVSPYSFPLSGLGSGVLASFLVLWKQW